MNKNTILIILSILLIAGAYFVYGSFNNNGNEIEYITSDVEKGEIIFSIKATGKLNPTKEARIFPSISGVVEDILTQTNDKITKNQTLALIDSSEYQARYNQARAHLKKAKEDLSSFKLNHEVNERLFEKQLISKQEFDNSLSSYRTSIVVNEEAIADLQRARINLEKTKIKSPFNGIVLEQNLIIGQQLLTNKSLPIYVLAENLEKLHLVTNVSEADIGTITHGQKVVFTVDAFPGRNFEGEVVQISNSPINDNNLVTYNVISEVENTELNLKPGMSAEVEIVISKKENILKIPTAALRFTPKNKPSDKNQTLIWVLSNNELKSVPIKTGINDDYYTEITEGNLNGNDKVVVESYVTNQKKDGPSFALPQPKRF